MSDTQTSQLDKRDLRLLVFNLATDADDPILGFTTGWLNSLASRVAAIDVITMRAGRLAVADNVRVLSVGRERGFGRPRRALNFYRLLLGLLRRHRYAACLAHMMPLFALMGSPLLRWKGVRTILWYAHKATSPVLRAAEKVVDVVATSSPSGFRIPSEKMVVTGQGIDTTLFSPAAESVSSQDSFVISSVGRIAPVKRLEVLLEAAHLLGDNPALPEVVVRLAGPVHDGDRAYADRLLASVDDMQRGGSVEYLGPLSAEQVVEEYRRATVMVNVSDTGSLDKAVLEAMACGVPVVTSNEAFRGELDNPFIELQVAKDDPRSIAEICSRIARLSDDTRVDLGRHLRRRVVERHSLERLTDELLELLIQGG